MPQDDVVKHTLQAKKVLRELEDSAPQINLAAGLILSARLYSQLSTPET